MHKIQTLLQTMARLRDPKTGCAWDLQQNFATIAPYTLEETHEVLDAIARNDMDDLRDELGDLLLQVVFHAQIASDIGAFTFDDVAASITDKLHRRHPHIFGDATGKDAESVKTKWDEIKRQEQAQKNIRLGREGGSPSILSDIPNALPALMYATKLGTKAASVGFDWPNKTGPLQKVHEELAELEIEIAANDSTKIQDEIGDLLFSICNLARHLNVSPEICLLNASRKFKTRFTHLEQTLAQQNQDIKSKSLDELEELWKEAKEAV